MIKKAFLDRMYFRLYERKALLADKRRAKAIDITGLNALNEAVLAIECSIADYIETHQPAPGAETEGA